MKNLNDLHIDLILTYTLPKSMPEFRRQHFTNARIIKSYKITRKSLMLKKMLITCLTLSLSTQNVQAKLPDFKHYVIFGDSLTDVGNYTTSSNNCIYFNAPITNHTNELKKQFTNTTWANAGRLKNILSSNDGGSNYAVAGYTSAQILTSIKNYKINHAADLDTLYIIWAGTNDVLYAIGSHWSQKAVTNALLDGTKNVVLSLENLYDIGARNFLIIGLMDLSNTPMVTYSHPSQSNLIGIFSNKEQVKLQQACMHWNSILFPKKSNSNENKIELFKQQHPNSHIYGWNPTSILTKITENPRRYGYLNRQTFNTKNSNIQDKEYPITQITYCGNTANNADHNPEHYIFYNFIHPTPSVYYKMEQDMMHNAFEF